MTVPIIGQQQAWTVADVISDFQQRKMERNVTNASRDNTIAALIICVEMLMEQRLKDHPELMEQAKAMHEEAQKAQGVPPGAELVAGPLRRVDDDAPAVDMPGVEGQVAGG